MKKTILFGVATATLISCQSYQPVELKPQDILSEIESQRNKKIDLETFTFAQAASAMDTNNLRLQQIRQQYKGLQEVANLKTPLANPTITAGPAKGSRLEDTTSSSTQAFIGIAFNIPLGPRLRRNDELNELIALRAYNEQVLNHRQLYFELREAYVSYSLSQKAIKLQNKIEKTLETTANATKKLFDFGSTSKLSLTEVKLQQGEISLEKLDQIMQSKEYLAELSNLLVIDEGILENLQLEILNSVDQNIEFQKLKQQFILNNPSLARAEMAFHLVDAELRLELAKQYPDLSVGFDADQEVGERKRTYAIPFSVELPIFDRNQQAIALSLSQREQKLITYKETMNSKISELKKIYQQQMLASQKLDILQDVLMPLSKSNLNDAKRAMELGTIDALRYMDMIKDHQKMQLQVVAHEIEHWQIKIQLEMLCGFPLSSNNQADINTLEIKKMELSK
ncbi:TolC family protein [Lentisphaera profundi]|uniref:TolC family protein n=1 Tax=Lentisphaera profundi TaxID=1658616 RepID=A0ABY7VQC7_9BACT|nr:TolC family protein [Lentisphaera profundi]WDE95917.1 TolC family protein [Lentisphaera profundi]